MDKEMQERIAVFRFGLISSLVSHKGLSRGEQELRIGQITHAHGRSPDPPKLDLPARPCFDGWRCTSSPAARWIPEAPSARRPRVFACDGRGGRRPRW